ncbi:MAG: hypothetical protein KC442_16385 [Thermomicrobiales bacterium]|nr:hypothetical protein [Thermomicrobiales bacterium]
MISFVTSMPCSPWAARWGSGLLAIVLAWASILPLVGSTAAQGEELTGVRGSLFESPALGWIALLPQGGGWEFSAASSEVGGDFLQALHPSGVSETVIGYQDADDDAAACAQLLLDTLAMAYPDVALTGWHDDEITVESFSPETALVQALVPDPAGDDVYAYISCQQHPGNLLLGDMLLQPNSVLESGDVPIPLMVQPPGQGNTGRPHASELQLAPGVMLFAGRGAPVLTAGMPYPFSCVDQDSFTLPPDPLPEGMGYFACDGQVVNADAIPVTLALGGFALGCFPGLFVDPEAGPCPEAPVRASHAEVLDTTGVADGATVTLAPGESVDLVLWFTLPEGLPPQDLLYLDGEQTFQAGPTYFSAGLGSRPRVRMTR